MNAPWRNIPPLASNTGPITIQSTHAAFADGLAGNRDYVDPMFAALGLLAELAETERLIPGLLCEIRARADAIRDLSNIAEDRAQAQRYLDAGRFDEPESAYYHLDYRTARKGLGIDRAIRIAEFAIETVGDNKPSTVTALRSAIAAMREEDGSEELQRVGRWKAAEFRLGVQELLASASAAAGAA